MDAFMILQMGMADYMVCGGSEAPITPMSVAGFNSAKALSTANDRPEKASRPYDVDRDGFVMGEGAGSLLLETLESATKRGAKIYAELVGVGASADAYHLTAPHPEGLGAVTAMNSALSMAGITPDKIDYINTHGTSTPLGDLAEVAAIKKVFGQHAYNLNISSTKSMTGHLLGAAGVVESIACILALQNQIVPPTINCDNLDPQIDLDVTPNTPKERKIEYALNNGFGFGGHNGCLIFRKSKVD
jgi:3-oxoacyl-[acyl-carrier-protein] synthase II